MNQLNIFTRYPVPGKVKTRLIPELGEEGAALLHQRMAEDTIQRAHASEVLTDVDVRVWFTGASAEQMQSWLGEEICCLEQPSCDLGQRIFHVIEQGMQQGYTKVVIIGTDCPDLSSEIIQQAFLHLENSDVVLGPASDGGYYLIGVRCADDSLFTDIEWGGADVLKHTRQKAEALGLSVSLLSELHDIDFPEDLVHCRLYAGVSSVRLSHWQ